MQPTPVSWFVLMGRVQTPAVLDQTTHSLPVLARERVPVLPVLLPAMAPALAMIFGVVPAPELGPTLAPAPRLIPVLALVLAQANVFPRAQAVLIPALVLAPLFQTLVLLGYVLVPVMEASVLVSMGTFAVRWLEVAKEVAKEVART